MIFLIILTILLILPLYIIFLVKRKKELFHFEVTPEKKCRLFPYLWSDECYKLYKKGLLTNNPYFCEHCSPNFKCNKCGLYKGFKTYFNYTPESNKYWKNERCVEDTSYNIQVL